MLNFIKVTLHNFGSYTHAEVDLQNKGFCLVTGENHYVKDNALSNGSGKSFIWSGICFAITGETIQGLKSNLKNIYNDDKDAYVSLDFYADKDHFELTRYIAPKSDLKIIKNGIDMSGKGIRESEEKLEALLPDLTSELIASSIIIGQGMPNKFSAFKPSGRKELLEKLTKSDFMIEDVKNRIAARLATLNSDIQTLDNKILITSTKVATHNTTLTGLQEKQASAVKPDFDAEITKVNTQLAGIEEDIKKTKKAIDDKEKLIEQLNSQVLTKTTEKSEQLSTLREEYTKATTAAKAAKVETSTKIRGLEADLAKFRQHPDICPTCGQKLPNADHILEERQKKEDALKTLQEHLKTVNEVLDNADKRNAEYTTEISKEFDADLQKLNKDLSDEKQKLSSLKNDLNDFSHYHNIETAKLSQLNADKNSWDTNQAAIAKNISDLTTTINTLNDEITTANIARNTLVEHLDRVRKLETLTKRDFRGYILSDIIKYIDSKAKVYSSIVFKHTDLNIYLDGNDLDISYNGKMFDNLSGGEKQRVDLIIQFALRDFLTTFLNAGSNILVLDEITDNLDKESCAAIMSLIEQELKAVESVFVISHHADELVLPIDTTIHVCKQADGISTLTQN